MKKPFMVSFALAALSLASVQGQERPRPDVLPQATAGVTPRQGWGPSYQPESPRDYVRRRAQEKAEARKARIEGMNWLGYSLSRPTTTVLPFMGHAPTWSATGSAGFWGYPYWSHPVNFIATPGMP